MGNAGGMLAYVRRHYLEVYRTLDSSKVLDDVRLKFDQTNMRMLATTFPLADDGLQSASSGKRSATASP
jgi:hypothetical protein